MPTKPIDASAKPRPFRILALAGGGFLGFYTACVLAEMERRHGEPLARRFDLIAGTSVGGILAVALAYEFPMASMVALFREHGAKIFSDRKAPNTSVGRLLDLSRSVLGPKYDNRRLRKLLQALIGDATLKDAKHRLVVPAVDVSRSLTKVFKTPHSDDSRGDGNVSAVDVAMATAAAPGYFAAVPLGDRLYADGGLFAVAPDQVAMHEAEHFLGIKGAAVRMLSVGTATAGYQPDDGAGADDGAIGWLSDGRLILTLVSVQQQHVQAMMEQRLRQRYYRIDAPWPRKQRLGIDIASADAVKTLEGLAMASVGELDADRLRRLFRLRVVP